MPSKAKSLLQKIKRRTWMKFALRGVGGNDNFERLDLAYSIEDPWNMDSPGERARFEATNRIIEREFGPLDSLLELGCGEGHQTLHFASLARQTYGLDVSEKAIERARERVPAGKFAAADIFSQPWLDAGARVDLVTACEVLYYLSDVEATLKRMSELGRNCLVTIFAPAARRVGPHLERIPGLKKDWVWYGGTVWLVCWWRNE
ncbi:MAG: class I SAM-dependent methyltransferase [Dokdonella sp.]|jgi:cyclopropane fatty-acyl-phospholipid synthase-like methyltransferase|uniref:class I SAM-dependent methyltransferase n=1 Tax=Dokdonella sp. TaxID=2291710 RepID=UPI001B5E5BA7|nr:class I SAM-dependent methyltransferase [Dokdonella sp.]MCC6439342.1 class I SAM-dependent methyltransferase [Rhodanobacteraceae bacterium]MBK8124126.1 class I SAM-dependent methyltransferase [Dokdonella sp.]MBP6327228.1 class I SAM-dependent methyltransferase [Dokdonella sp.]MBP6329504.1 class I SAM-dependent methyltransferase [Dokdonella sp.]HNV08207.1 class I SAM-dependent methyltransferase [Dokdonella sp.]